MVLEIKSTDEFNNLIKSAKLTVVDFYADWCGPCKAIAPRFQSLAEQYQSVQFTKVNVDTCKEIASSEEVRAMPTFKIYKAGKVLKTIVGADIASIENFLKQSTNSGFESQGRTLNGSIKVPVGDAGFAGLSGNQYLIFGVAAILLYMYMNQ